jgi:signal transduction histidine kinase
MLHRFIEEHAEQIAARARATMAMRIAPRPTASELTHGVPLFLRELVQRLRDHEDPDAIQIGASASLHGGELLAAGFTIGQVVFGYGDVCQAVTGIMVELGAQIATADFGMLSLCLDIAIAEAVTEYARQRERAIVEDGVKNLGFLAHELRNLLGTATLAFEALSGGSIGITGSTGRILGNSLLAMNDLVTRSLADVRIDGGVTNNDQIVVADLFAEVSIAAALKARSRDIRLTFEPVDSHVLVDGDAQIVASIVTNLVQNACKFTRAHGAVVVSTRSTVERVFIDVADECGGLPPRFLDRLFLPYEQRATDRSGLGLGLAICMKGAHAVGGDVTVHDVPGTGCIFTVELRRSRAG